MGCFENYGPLLNIDIDNIMAPNIEGGTLPLDTTQM